MAPHAYLNHVNVALGSVGELWALLEIASRLSLITAADERLLSGELEELGKLLYGLRRSLARRVTPERT